MGLAWLLVVRGGYQASLIDYRSNGRSNTNPPPFYTAVVGLAQVGVLMILARSLDHLGARFRAFWTRAGTAAIAVCVWHLTALTICVAVVAIPAVPAPRRLSAAWWWSRPLWYVAVFASSAVLVGATALIRARLRTRTRTSPTSPSTGRLALGIVIAAGGGGLVGLYGPTNVPRALGCLALLVVGWALLRSASA